MPTLTEIEGKAEKLAKARTEVANIVGAMTEAIDAIKRCELPKLRKAVARVAEHQECLKAMIEASPELFEKPKTVTFHGIRMGYMKGKGGIAWDDADAVVQAILKHMPDQAEALIRWTGKPLKEAINQLDVATLRKIGCRVVDTGESVFIKPVDSEWDKLAESLLRDNAEEERVA